MFVLALSVQLHFPECRSLKSKRAELRPIIEGARHRFAVAVAEIAAQELWQRAEVGVSTVASSEHRAVEVMDEVERFVWSFPTVEVLSTERHWLEIDRP
jgi:uncharacterized protein YlxP (DUF503 family)